MSILTDAIKWVIDEKIRDRIEEGQTWGMKVKKRRWQEYHTAEIVEYLAADIDRKVNLNNPDWIVWVDVVGREATISLLGPDDIFSLMLPHF
jgi:tRNA(Ser,Leu) C12 N-acetylase TAN1